MITIAEKIYYSQTKEYRQLCQFSCDTVVPLNYFIRKKIRFVLPKKYIDRDRAKEIREIDREMRTNKAHAR